MSVEVRVAIIALLLQAIGILVALYVNNKSHEKRDIDKKKVFNSTKKAKKKFKLLKHSVKK